MFIINYINSPKICGNIHFDVIKLNNKRHMVPVPKNAAILIWLMNDHLALQEALNSA